MTTEQSPPWPQENRRSRWWPFESGLVRPVDSRQARPGWSEPLPATPADGQVMDEPGPADHSVPPENGSVLQGEVVTDDELAARELANQKEQAAAERLPLPPTFRQELRMQLADFAERAHQKRLNPACPELLGCGGGITEQVVHAMAKAITAQNLPGPAGSHEDHTDLLLGALAATDPKQVADPGHVSFVTLRGRLMLDVSTAALDGESLTVDFVRLPNRSETSDQDGAGPEMANQPTAEPATTDAQLADDEAAGHDAAAAAGGGDGTARYAAVICGPAAAIAGGRPFLGMDALTTYARREAFRRFAGDTDPHAAGSGMHAAHSIEIVVLLDPSLDGGVWVDIDPATGSPVAAMSIAVKPAGFRFTRLAAA